MELLSDTFSGQWLYLALLLIFCSVSWFCVTSLGKTAKMITCFWSVAIICVEKLCFLSFFTWLGESIRFLGFWNGGKYLATWLSFLVEIESLLTILQVYSSVYWYIFLLISPFHDSSADSFFFRQTNDLHFLVWLGSLPSCSNLHVYIGGMFCISTNSFGLSLLLGLLAFCAEASHSTTLCFCTVLICRQLA